MRVHTDPGAAGLADGLNARAFTVGRDVAFAQGEYRPGTPIGDALIAHELPHVAQQSGAGPTGGVAGKRMDGGREDLEEDADVAAIGAVASLWGSPSGAGRHRPGHDHPRAAVPPGRAAPATPALPPRIGGHPAPVAAPTENYVVPFDQHPLSAPGEQIIFNDQFDHATPNLFQLKFTATGGKFDTATGPAVKTIPGLVSGNQFFFINSTWDGTSAVSVTLQVQKVADSSVVWTRTWTFGKKVHYPTMITQQEAEGEVALPGVYSYKLGPDLGADGVDDYLHQTILESFGQRTCNITMADLNAISRMPTQRSIRRRPLRAISLARPATTAPSPCLLGT